MKTTNRLLSLLIALICLATAWQGRAANIVFVSNFPNTATTAFWSPPIAGADDDSFVTLLQAAGHNVVRFNSDDSQNNLLSAADIAALNTNDLVIIGRSPGSAAFQAPVANQWNTNITKPLLCQNAYLARNSRLGWFAGSDDVPNGLPLPLEAVSMDATNAFLFGTTAMNGTVMADPYDTVFGQNTSQINPTNLPVAGARVLATMGTTNVIVEFPSGTVVKGGANVLAGYRLYMASGVREGNGVVQAGTNSLSSAGQAVFMRAVRLALNNGDVTHIDQAPLITTAPVGSGVCAGAAATLTVVATGEEPLRYQWYFNDTTPVVGGTGATLTINNVQAGDAGNYTVIITNDFGAITSAPVAIVITGTATLATGPSNWTDCPGTPATFTTSATGSGTLSYTWRKGTTVLQGPDGNNSFSIASPSATDSGSYSVIVAGECNSVTNNFTVTVIAAPVIATQPVSQATPMGNGAVFTVAATAAVAPTYQWLTNGVEVTGATFATFAISNLTLLDSGMAVSVIASTCAGSTPSTVATLTVTPISGISFNFDTPGQFTNQPYYMVYNDWLNTTFNTPVSVSELSIGGVGPFPGNGSLDLIPNNGTVNSAIFLPLSFDFSLPAKSLTASAMVQIKNPVGNNRTVQLGFTVQTNSDLGNNAGTVYMSAILQSTAQPALTYQLRTGNKPTAANAFQEGNNSANLTLIISNWYRLSATFANTPGAVPGIYTATVNLENMGTDGLAAPTPVATIGAVTLTNVDATSARNLYLVVRTTENAGIEALDNFHASTATGDVTFVQQPQSQTVLQGRRATFKALVDGSGPFTYQWNKNGVPIPGATAWKYLTPPVTAADAGNYTVTVTGPFPEESAPATLTVTADPLIVVGAGSVDGTTVGVEFNQPVDSISAANPANYLVNGAAPVAARVYKTSVGPMGPDGIYVILTPATILAADFTLSAPGVKDLGGNVIGTATSPSGFFAGMTGVDINPLVTAPAGENYCFGPGRFIMMGGGSDIWNNADLARYMYTQKTGDFDVKMKVPYLDVVRSATKAGFHVRSSLDAFDKAVTAAVNPMWPGRNYPEGSTRQTNNLASTSWGANPTYGLAWYPDAWLRFRRAGNVFLRYSSTNGVNWIYDGQTSSGGSVWQWMVPETLYFGLAVSAVGNNNACSAKIEQFGDFAGYPGAAIAINSQPTNFTVNAGSSFTDGVLATVSGGGIPATAGELVYVWQRNNGSGVWTNLVSGGATNHTVAIGPLFVTDNGAEFRCVLRAPGATEVVSSTFTATVNDTALPTIAQVNATLQESYPVAEVSITFSEPVDPTTALNTANYTITNAAGVVMTISEISFLNGDPRTVFIKVSSAFGTGISGVTVSGVRDLNNNQLATATRTFRTFAPATGPVVIEVYQDMGNMVTVDGAASTGTNFFVANTPTYITYSNIFGCNVNFIGSLLSGLNYTLGTIAAENYVAKGYTYFIAPTNGAYKFWIRSDDGMQLWMNTNGPLVRTLRPSSQNAPANQEVQFCVDGNSATKWLNFDKLNTGFSITPANGPKTVTALQFTTGGDAPERDPMTYTLEGTSGDPVSGPWTLISNGSTGLDTDPGRGATAPAVTFANATAYTTYRLTFPTVRTAASANSMQVAEVALLDAGSVNVALDIGKVKIAENTASQQAYTVGTVPANSITNITLVAGQRYYMEFILKEATGNDGCSITWTAPTVTTAPVTNNFIPLANLEYPANAARPTPVVFELYTGLQNFMAGFNTITGLWEATNRPTVGDYVYKENWKYLSGIADFVGYGAYFGFQPTYQYNSRYDNYLGRAYSFFIAPSNGLYKFYIAVDDAAALFMNTNAVNSTDPYGKVLLGTRSGATLDSQLVAQNVPLVAGQKYYTEVLWREGGGGDGIRLAVRSQGDATVPTRTEWIQASMLEYPAGLCRAGAVNYDYLAPVNPTVAEGQRLMLNPVGVRGTRPYGGFSWYKNGQLVMANSFTNYTPPLTMADNGSVYTLVITNAFSSVSRSITVNVQQDTVAPTIIRTAGFRYGDGFSIVFSEPVDALSATFLGNYQVSGGLQLLSATLDQTRKVVSFTTSPQAAGTTYAVTISGVKDVSSAGNMIAANTPTSFSTWSVGGNGFLVELWLNIPNGGIVDLTGQPAFQANLPDISYYTNVFGVGPFGANSGLENYGARVTGYFIPTNTAYYRFYTRSDDASQLWMNINSADSENPAGRTMLVHQPGANVSMALPLSQSRPVMLNAGQRYYIEGLLKEGTGGDYMMAAFRECDANGTALAGTPADVVGSIASAGSFGGAPGNPDLVQITGTPPSDLSVTENDPINLVLTATVPASYRFATSYQWQKFDSSSSTFTNIPGATATNLTFAAALADDGVQYKVLFSAPGRTASYITTLHVAVDTTPPYILSVGTLDGYTVAVQWNEPVQTNTSADVFNNYIFDGNGTPMNVTGQTGTPLPDNRTVLFYLDRSQPPITTPTFRVDSPLGVFNQAQTPLEANSTKQGVVLFLNPFDIGTPGTTAAGNVNPASPGFSYSVTNATAEMSANGWDTWNAVDGFHFAARQVTGNFDIKARVDTFVGADQWSKAGIMARPTTNGNSRFLMMATTPPVSPITTQAPVNNFSFQGRVTDGVTAALNWQSNTPAYPNVWLRLQRVGAVFNGYFSSNGVDWVLQASVDTATVGGGAFADTLWLGLAGVSHDQTRALANNAKISWRDIYFPQPPVIVTQPGPTPQTVAIRQNATFSGMVVSGIGPFSYQWRKNGQAITGATSDSYTVTDTKVADSGTYTVFVANDGGAAISADCVLIVSNALPVTVGETNSIAVNGTLNVTTGTLLANDSDPEGDPLSVLGVSGVYPVTVATNFDEGTLEGSTLFNNGIAGSGTWDPTAGNNGTGGIAFTPPGVGSAAGSLVINELTPGKRISSFTASFKLKMSEPSAEPADGFSFNFAPDLPAAATGPRASEDGVGNGVSFCVDNYRFQPFVGVGSPAGSGPSTTANTSGLKVNYKGFVVAGVQIPTWVAARYVPVSVTVSADGILSVLVDGTNVFGNINLPGYTPMAGSFGFYARTGGQYMSQRIDDLSITALTTDTALNGQVGLTNGVVTYTPPVGGCGITDTFYYLVNDGQLGGTVVESVDVEVGGSAPSLAIEQQGANLLISWPECGTFTLVASGDVSASPATWTPVGVAPVLINGRWVATIPAPATTQFYLLRNP